MKLPKFLASIGFTVGSLGPLLFYLSPYSWVTFELHYVCPWCPYIDGPFLTWASWLSDALHYFLAISCFESTGEPYCRTTSGKP